MVQGQKQIKDIENDVLKKSVIAKLNLNSTHTEVEIYQLNPATHAPEIV